MEEVGRIYAYPIGPGGVVISIESSLVVSLARPEKVCLQYRNVEPNVVPQRVVDNVASIVPIIIAVTCH